MEVRPDRYNFESVPSQDHSNLIWFQSEQWFLRLRYYCVFFNQNKLYLQNREKIGRTKKILEKPEGMSLSWSYLIYFISLLYCDNNLDTACVHARLGCTRLTAASDKAYQFLPHGRWFSGYSGFFQHSNWSSWYSWNIAESGDKHNKSNQVKSNQ